MKSLVARQQVIRNLSEPSEFTFMRLDICRLSETSRATHLIEGCASVVNNGWHSNKETSRALHGILWTISSDVERGRG